MSEKEEFFRIMFLAGGMFLVMFGTLVSLFFIVKSF